MGTHKIYSGIQGITDNISGSLYGDCYELLACNSLVKYYSIGNMTSFVHV